MIFTVCRIGRSTTYASYAEVVLMRLGGFAVMLYGTAQPIGLCSGHHRGHDSLSIGLQRSNRGGQSCFVCRHGAGG